jgi:hypothetical protein
MCVMPAIPLPSLYQPIGLMALHQTKTIFYEHSKLCGSRSRALQLNRQQHWNFPHWKIPYCNQVKADLNTSLVCGWTRECIQVECSRICLRSFQVSCHLIPVRMFCSAENERDREYKLVKLTFAYKPKYATKYGITNTKSVLWILLYDVWIMAIYGAPRIWHKNKKSFKSGSQTVKFITFNDGRSSKYYICRIC